MCETQHHTFSGLECGSSRHPQDTWCQAERWWSPGAPAAADPLWSTAPTTNTDTHTFLTWHCTQVTTTGTETWGLHSPQWSTAVPTTGTQTHGHSTWWSIVTITNTDTGEFNKASHPVEYCINYKHRHMGIQHTVALHSEEYCFCKHRDIIIERVLLFS